MDNFTLRLLSLLDEEQIEFKTFIEFLALRRGLKSVVRLVVDETTFRLIHQMCDDAGIECLRSDFGLKETFSTDLLDRFYEITDCLEDSEFTVLFCGGKDSVIEANTAERCGCDSERLARLYGYPNCCARNYHRIQKGEHWIDSYLSNAINSEPYSWLTNKIAYLFQPHLTIFADYFPCSINCQDTKILASKYRDLLVEMNLTCLLDIVKEALSRPIFVHNDIIYQFKSLLHMHDKYVNSDDVSTINYAIGDLTTTPLTIREIQLLDLNKLRVYTEDQVLNLDRIPGKTDLLLFS